MSLIERIKKHEGFEPLPYRDDKGVLTIGYGTNLDIGIDRNEAELLLKYRLDRVISQVDATIGSGTIAKLSEEQREVLYELGYWLGIGTFQKFKKMIQAIKDNDYIKASEEMLDSKAGR